jgi:hypothetical protein
MFFASVRKNSVNDCQYASEHAYLIRWECKLQDLAVLCGSLCAYHQHMSLSLKIGITGKFIQLIWVFRSKQVS